MIRKIIKINEDKCIGCGRCVDACHEGAIGMVDGVATLLRDDYCDGLGDCLPSCPVEAISFEEREAAAYDEKAVMAKTQGNKEEALEPLPCGCPGSSSKVIERGPIESSSKADKTTEKGGVESQLSQWPVQIKLAPVNASYFKNANLLIAADCSAFAYGNFHEDFIKNKITLIGCPKLDAVDYSEKLTEIIRKNSIKSITVVRMEVPCCGGIVSAVTQALKNSGKMIPWQVHTISTDGKILEA
ncbi:MAG: ATP-binding protein [Eubacteriaceae bacterium]